MNLDDCTMYEGKDGYVLLDRNEYEALKRLKAENERLTKSLQELRDSVSLEYVGGPFCDVTVKDVTNAERR